MEKIISMPNPAVICLIGVFLAVKCEFVLRLIDKLCTKVRLGSQLRGVIFFAILFLPLLFASWQGMGAIQIAGKIICYILVLFVGFMIGNLMD